MYKIICLSVFFFFTGLVASEIQHFRTDKPCDVPQRLFFAHNRTCDGYYFCLQGIWYEGFCRQMYSFTEEKQMCDWKERVDCSRYPVTPTPPEPSGSFTVPTQPPTTEKNYD